MEREREREREREEHKSWELYSQRKRNTSEPGECCYRGDCLIKKLFFKKTREFFYLGNMNKKRHTKRHIFQRTALFLVWSLRKINRMLINSVDYS